MARPTCPECGANTTKDGIDELKAINMGQQIELARLREELAAAKDRIAELEQELEKVMNAGLADRRRADAAEKLLDQCARQIDVWVASGKLDRRNHAAAKALIDLIELRIERGE